MSGPSDCLCLCSEIFSLQADVKVDKAEVKAAKAVEEAAKFKFMIIYDTITSKYITFQYFINLS